MKIWMHNHKIKMLRRVKGTQPKKYFKGLSKDVKMKDKNTLQRKASYTQRPRKILW